MAGAAIAPDAPPPHLDEADEADPCGDADRGPMRRCLVTRQSFERARMLRFVLSPDRVIVADLAARLPGRGMWLSPRADVIETARAKGAFARAASRFAGGGPVAVPADLLQTLRTGLTRRVADQLGLARRAGQAVAGFTKAREWVAGRRAFCVVQAADGSAEERQRLVSGASGLPVAWPLSAAELGAVFGRDHAVHVAVAPGRIAQGLMDDIERLAGVSAQTLVKQAGE